MKALVIFSNASEEGILRLDKEDKLITKLSKKYTIEVDRLHASEIDDIHDLLTNGDYDIIQFSCHGYSDGILLQKTFGDACETDYISSERLVALLSLPEKPPLLVIFLCCYSDEYTEKLIDSAPFVVTSKFKVGDLECLTFIQGLYERLFNGYSIDASFKYANNLLKMKDRYNNDFVLSRRVLSKKENSIFVESKPDPSRNSIIVNLDQVYNKIKKLEISEEQLSYLLSNKLTIHYWIFHRARENATIPIGRLLFGEFWWENAKDVVYCKRIMKLRHDVSQQHWQVWSNVLTSYNDLASCEYRKSYKPTNPECRGMLERALNLFNYHTEKNFKPLRVVLKQLEFNNVIPNLEFAITHCNRANDHYYLERHPQMVEALELSLTNYHEVVTLLQPPEEKNH